MDLSDALLAFDLESYLQARGVQYWTSGKNVSTGWLGLRHDFGPNSCGDHSNHLGVHLRNKNFTCWRCGYKGSGLTLIKELDQCTFREAVKTLGDFQRWFVAVPLVEEGDKIPFSLPEEAIDQPLKIHAQWLRSRGYDPEEVTKLYGLKFVGAESDDWPNRIIIPVKMNHRTVSFLARDVTNLAVIKYKYCPDSLADVSRRELIYGVGIDKRHSLLLVEGVLDAWRIGPGAVAMLSIQWTQEQVNRIVEHPAKTIYIAFDGEPLAIARADKLAAALAYAGKTVEVVELPEGKDPDTLDPKDIRELQKMLM